MLILYSYEQRIASSMSVGEFFMACSDPRHRRMGTTRLNVWDGSFPSLAQACSGIATPEAAPLRLSCSASPARKMFRNYFAGYKPIAF
jgi:hypothetical protein